MNRWALLSVLSGLSTVTITVILLRGRRHRISIKHVDRDTFITIMKELAESAFQIFFEYSQMAVRVHGASGHREPFDPVARVKQNDSHIRKSLDIAQTAILRKYYMNVESLIAAQEQYSDLNELIDVIPDMFTAYTRGDFPVLPSSIWPSLTKSDPEIFEEMVNCFEVCLSAGEKVLPVPLATKNLVATRINESEDFKTRLLQIVINAQARVRAKVA